MSPVQTNTTRDTITVPAASDFSASIGCFANVGTDGKVALPSSSGFALYVIEDAYTSGGIITPPSGTATGQSYYVVLRALTPGQNIRVRNGTAPITAPGIQVATDTAGKAIPASSGGYILAISEGGDISATGDYPTVAGQYTLIRPLGGIQTK